MGTEMNVKRLDTILDSSSGEMADIRRVIESLVHNYVLGLDDKELSDTRSPEYRAAIGLFNGWLMQTLYIIVMQALVSNEVALERERASN